MLHFSHPPPTVTPAPRDRPYSQPAHTSTELHQWSGDWMPGFADAFTEPFVCLLARCAAATTPVLHVVFDAAGLPIAIRPQRATIGCKWPLRYFVSRTATIKTDRGRFSFKLPLLFRIQSKAAASTQKTEDASRDNNVRRQPRHVFARSVFGMHVEVKSNC